MTISGFTMVRNGESLYYPVRESILSALPLVDEFVVALGKGDPDDRTLEWIESMRDPKIKIIHTEWDIVQFPNGMENARQTNIAKQACTGDWLIYLQADEVLHEQELPVIRQRCLRYLNQPDVEGMIFRYHHFWGDYFHVHHAHGWYPHEIRIIRNDPDIHSWESAQSFRRIPNFEGKNFRQQEGTHKLKVVSSGARIFHYGYVRPPDFMQRKRKSLDAIHKGTEAAEQVYQQLAQSFDYGPLGRIPYFKGSHPLVMEPRIEAFDWAHMLNYGSTHSFKRPLYKHEKWSNRLLTWVEQHMNEGKQLFQFKNYILLDL